MILLIVKCLCARITNDGTTSNKEPFSGCNVAKSMSSLNLKAVDERTVLLIFGYISSIEKSFDLFIHDVIKIVCLTYYGIKDYFFKYGDNIQVSKNSKAVRNNTSIENTAYGSYIIGNNTINNKKFYIYKWKFEIKACYNIHIGIDNADALWIDTVGRYKAKSVHYALASWGCLYSFPVQFPNNNRVESYKIGDIIVMTLNMKTESLKWYKSGQVIASIDNILMDNHTKYRMFVHLFGGSTVKLLNSQIKRLK